MQPYFFPYIGYWQLLQASNKFVILDDANFIKKGYVNRNSILAAGKAERINLQLVGISQNKLINQIELGNNNDKTLKTICLNYKKAPHFNEAYPVIEDILRSGEKNLAKFLGYSIQHISSYLDIACDIVYSSEIKKDSSLRAEDKIIDICRRLKASHYINAIGGRELYRKETFMDNGIKLNFIKTELTEYKQYNNKFVPSLSIIDIMMFNGVHDIAAMLNSYELT
jgi:hypothetical protein